MLLKVQQYFQFSFFPQPRLNRFVRRGLGVFAGLFLGFYLLLRFFPTVPIQSESSPSAALFDEQGKLINLSLSKEEKYQLHLALSEISPEMIKTTLAYEDRYFYYHPGVNLWALLRALWLSASERPVGASTITMQLARLRLGLNTRSLRGKLKQIFYALAWERQYSKKQILEAYLNQAPYGANIEGVGAASWIYFSKDAKQLSRAEAISLSVLPQDPSRRWKKKGRQARLAAEQRLLVALGSSGEKLGELDFRGSPASVPQRAPHLLNRLRELYPKQGVFPTVLNLDLQDLAESAVREYLESIKELGINNATVLLVELPQRKVRAYVGSAQYLDPSIQGFVNGLSAKRSPGSLLKPFIYALALEQGLILPETLLYDLPVQLSSYRPENFERNFLGPIPATAALVRSRNIPALEVFRSLTPSSFYNFLQQAGVSNLAREDYYGIALVLGGLGVSSEEIAALYAGLLDQGVFKPLRFLKAENQSGEKKLFTPEVSFLSREMLAKNPAPTGLPDRGDVAWKTGTSYGARDAWSAGIYGDFVIVTWLGNFSAQSNPNLIGRDIAGPLLFKVVEKLRAKGILSKANSAAGLNLKKLQVCALSGALPTEDCPHRKESWFIPGVSPNKTCEIHRGVFLNPQTGERLCPGQSSSVRKVYEFWPSDMQLLFAKVGLARTQPPPFEPACGLAGNNSELRIISPEEHVEYRLQEGRDTELSLLVRAPADSKEIFWFVDDVLLAKINPQDAAYWSARPGLFILRAVDDRGRVASIKLKVSQRGD